MICICLGAVLLASQVASVPSHWSWDDSEPLQVANLSVMCDRRSMTIDLHFTKPFHGIIYSQDHYDHSECNYVTTKNNGDNSYNFKIPAESCGTILLGNSSLNGTSGQEDPWFENTLIIQRDPVLQEEGDLSQRLRCTWQTTIRKSVGTSPFRVYDPFVVQVQLNNRAVNTVMQVQRGRGAFSPPLKGYLHVDDQQTSLVIFVKDDLGQLDATVLECEAQIKDGARTTLTDANGCVRRPDAISPFHKVRVSDVSDADLILYTVFRAFQLPQRTRFNITCQVQLCYGHCPVKQCDNNDADSDSSTEGRRSRRETSPLTTVVELRREVIVGEDEDNAGPPTPSKQDLSIGRPESVGVFTFLAAFGLISASLVVLGVIVGLINFQLGEWTCRRRHDDEDEYSQAEEQKQIEDGYP